MHREPCVAGARSFQAFVVWLCPWKEGDDIWTSNQLYGDLGDPAFGKEELPDQFWFIFLDEALLSILLTVNAGWEGGEEQYLGGGRGLLQEHFILGIPAL